MSEILVNGFIQSINFASLTSGLQMFTNSAVQKVTANGADTYKMMFTSGAMVNVKPYNGQLLSLFVKLPSQFINAVEGVLMFNVCLMEGQTS